MLAEHAGATIAAGGKRLRPLLVFLAAGVGARAAPTASCAPRPPSSSSTARRSSTTTCSTRAAAAPRPADRRRHGRAATMATATGDLLFARAFARAGRQRPTRTQVRALSDACSALARGELLQRADAWDAAITLERYLRRCELKTARLFEAACRLGALERRRRTATAPRRAFGRRIGLAFQILDDVLDVSGPAERTGKHRGTDLLDGTVTLPLILARERDPELGALDLRDDHRRPTQAEEVCDRIAATGALDAARARGAGARRRRPRPSCRPACRDRQRRGAARSSPTASSRGTPDALKTSGRRPSRPEVRSRSGR